MVTSNPAVILAWSRRGVAFCSTRLIAVSTAKFPLRLALVSASLITYGNEVLPAESARPSMEGSIGGLARLASYESERPACVRASPTLSIRLRTAPHPTNDA
jgi:hypothetical protein